MKRDSVVEFTWRNFLERKLLWDFENKTCPFESMTEKDFLDWLINPIIWFLYIALEFYILYR